MATTTFQQEARLLRKVSGSTALEKVLRKAVKILARHGIPHLVGGGYAVQERGYARFTKDVHIIGRSPKRSCRQSAATAVRSVAVADVPSSMHRYRRSIHSSLVSISSAHISRKHDCSLGNTRTTHN